jgi:glycine/D-amino acid oxidase-like deaminating enzyme
MTGGYFNPHGGFVESGRVVARLAEEARRSGVIIREKTRIDELDAVHADAVVVCTGAWAKKLVPPLRTGLREAGQPVFHLAPDDPHLFGAEVFPTFGADIARTGYYGFPLHPREGVVKIANHGPGRAVDPDSPRDVPEEEEEGLRAFLKTALPSLANARITFRRTCIYGDTTDEHFWIARDPYRPTLTVATGGSGHAFKFAPLLGSWIADAALGRDNPALQKFRWRPELSALSSGGVGEEAARHHGVATPKDVR